MPTGLDLLREKAAGATPGDRRRSRRTARDILEEMAKVPVTPPAPSAPSPPEPGWLSRTASDVGDWLLGAGQMASNVIRNRFPEAPPEEPEPADVVTAARAAMRPPPPRRGYGVTGTWDPEATAGQAGVSPSELVAAIPTALPGPPVRPGAAAAVTPPPAIASVPSQVEVMRQPPGAAVEGIAAPKIPWPDGIGEPIKAPLLPWNATDQEYERHVAEDRLAALPGPDAATARRLPQRSTTMGAPPPPPVTEPEQTLEGPPGGLIRHRLPRVPTPAETGAAEAALMAEPLARWEAQRGRPPAIPAPTPKETAAAERALVLPPPEPRTLQDVVDLDAVAPIPPDLLPAGTRRREAVSPAPGEALGVEPPTSTVGMMAPADVPQALVFENYILTPGAPVQSAAQRQAERRKARLRGEIPSTFAESAGDVVIDAFKTSAVGAGIASGLYSTAAGMMSVVPWVEQLAGVKTGLGDVFKDAAVRIGDVAERLTPDDPGWLHTIAAGFGSAAAFFVPGMGLGRTLQIIRVASPRLALWVGSGTAAIMEAGTEAGAMYQDALNLGLSEQQATSRANHVFWQNLIVLAATNKVGIFSESGGLLRRTGKGIGAESFQEATQEVIGERQKMSVTENPYAVRDVFSPARLKQYGTAAVVGGAVGGVLGGGRAWLGRRTITEAKKAAGEDQFAVLVAEAERQGLKGDAAELAVAQMVLDVREERAATPAVAPAGLPPALRGQTPAEIQESGRQAALKALERERPQFVPAPETAATAPAPPAPAPTGAAAPAPPVAEAPTKAPEPPEAAPEPTPAPPVAPAPEKPAEGEEEVPKAPVEPVPVPPKVEPATPPEAPKVEPPPVKPEPAEAAPAFTLPRDLAGAKPRFGYGTDNYTLDFESDLDKALFTVAQTFKNKRDADYMAALRTVYPDSEEQTIRDLGRAVKDRVKLLVKGQDATQPVRVPAIMRAPTAKPVQAPKPPAVAPKVETPPEPSKPTAAKPKAEEPFDPNDINQLVRFVRARGRIAPSPSGDLVGEYADVPAHFKSKKGLWPERMAEAIEEASGVKMSDAELLGRLKRYKHLQAQQAATRAAERKDQAAQAALADLTEADLIRELAARLGITEDAARQIIEAGRPKVDEEAATVKLVLDAAARIEDERGGFLSESELVDAVAKETGRDPEEVRAILGQRETTAEALDTDPVQLIIDGAEQPEASPQRARARDLMDFVEELVDASGGVEEARAILEALPDDAESATPGRQGLPSVVLTKDDQRALLEYAFPRDRAAGVSEKAGASTPAPAAGAGGAARAATPEAGGEAGPVSPEGAPAAGAPSPAGGVAPGPRAVSADAKQAAIDRARGRLGRPAPPPGGVAETTRAYAVSDPARDADLLVDLFIVGQAEYEAGATDRAAWTERMRGDLGDEVQPHLDYLWELIDAGRELAQEVPHGKPAPTPVAGEAGGESPRGGPGGLPDLRRTGGADVSQRRLILARPEQTHRVEIERTPAAVRSALTDEQLQAAEKAIRAMEGAGAFLEADGTGAGKTRVILATASYFAAQGHPVVVVAPASVLKLQTVKGQRRVSGSYADDSAAMKVPVSVWWDGPITPGRIYVTTYEKSKALPQVENAVLVFDEAHALKNAESARALAGMALARRARAVLFSTATPVDRPLHLDYLIRSGLFGDRTAESVYRSLGMRQRSITVRTKSGASFQKMIWEIDPNVGEETVFRRMRELFDGLTERGGMIKREVDMADMDVTFLPIPLPPGARETAQRIADGLSRGGVPEGLRKAIILMHQRRQQEPYKLPLAALAAKRELDEGRQVVLFVSRVNYSEAVLKQKLYGFGGEVIDEIRHILAASEGSAGTLRRAVEALGITDIAELHGEAEEKASEAMEAFQSGRARVLIATPESGGIGINLDDRTGDRPRTVIMITAPFTATDTVQALGRVNRMTTKSDVRSIFLYSDLPLDAWNLGIVAMKLKALRATVRGGVEQIRPEDTTGVSERRRGRYTAGRGPRQQALPGAETEVGRPGEAAQLPLGGEKPAPAVQPAAPVPFTSVRYRERREGISGFPAEDIAPGERWEAYVQGVGTELFGSREEAEAWVASRRATPSLRTERTAFGDQGLIPGTPGRAIPTGKIAPEEPQRPIEETPLFGQGEEARRRASDEAQERLFEGRAAYRAVVGSPAFRRWFGDSKVVDEDGTPKVVYHGTGQPGFEVVDPAKLDPGALYGPGFYMTESAAIAGGTAGERTEIQFFPTREEAEAAPNRSGFVWSTGPEYHENAGKWAAAIKVPFTERRGYAHKVAPRNRPPTEINADVEALRRSPEYERMMAPRYLTAWEREEAERDIREYELSGNEMYLDMISGQPFNFPANAILERAGLRGAGGVYPLYAKIERPMAVDEPIDQETANRLADALERLPWVRPDRTDPLGRLRQSAATGETVEAALNLVSENLIIPGRLNGPLVTAHWPEVFRAAGYDGITHIGGRGDRERHRVWIAFEPTQVKSATGNVGTFSAEDASMVQEPRAPYASLPPDRFYSALRRAAEFRMPVKASADQVLATLRQTPGVKAEEIKDTGLEDWLRAQGDRPITRAEVLDYLRANEVRIEIKRLGGEAAISPDDAVVYDDVVQRRDAKKTRFGPDKHPNLSLPGAIGGTYVELLGKVPEDSMWRTLTRTLSGEQLAEFAAEGEGYEEPHFREANVVFHFRGAEHLDDQGRRGFLIEEAQSQWHLEGRRKGYKGPDAFVEGHDYDWWIREAERLFANPSKRDEWRRAVENRDALARTMHAVPPAPFAKSWHERAFKEALDYALRLPPDAQGRRIEWIGWTPGQVQVDRYDLSKQVTSAMWSEWNGRPDGNGTLLVVRRGNDRYESVARDIPVARLEEYVGKEVAGRLRAAAPNPMRDRVVSGLDLKIGGEWAYNLYDRTLPNFVRGYVKKWGARVGETNISTGVILKVVDREGQRATTSQNRAEAESHAQSVGGSVVGIPQHESIHAVPITDSMRRAVLEEGQAAFEPRARYTRSRDATPQHEALAQQALFGVAGAGEGQSLSSVSGVLPGRRAKTFALGFRGSLTAEGIARDLAALGEVDLRGRKLASAADAAVAFEVIRNPQVEVFWRFYLNDADEIVGHVMFTARLPGSAPVKSAATWAEEVPAILAEMKAVGATKVVLGHNHPTGDPAASPGDVEMTRRYERDIPGFQYHVIKDGPTYGIILRSDAARETANVTYLQAGPEWEVRAMSGAATRDPLLTPAMPHRVLGVPIVGSEDIVRLLDSLKAADGQALILYAGGSERRVRGAQIVPLADLRDPATAEAWFLDQGRAFGSSEVFVYTPKQDVDFYRLASGLIRSGALRDYVFGAGIGHTAAGPQPVIPEFAPGQVQRVEKLGPRAAESGRPTAVSVGGEPAIRVGEPVPRDEAGRFVSTEPGKALSDFLTGDEPGGVAEETGRYEPAGEAAKPDVATEIERLRAENAALREKRDATVKRARKGKEEAKKPQDDPVPTDPGPEVVKEHNARVEALPEEVRSNAVIRDTLYGPRRFLGLARRWFEARARGARAQSDRVTDETRAAAREALGDRADTLVIQGTPKDFGLFDMWDRPSRRIAMFGPLAESLIDTINLGELRMRIEYGERMDTEITGFRHVPRADWGKHGERFYDAFAGHPLDDILTAPALAPETKAAMVGLRDRMNADRLFIRDRKREENRGWVSRRVERELRAAGFALSAGGGRRSPAEMVQLRAEVDRVTDERLRDMIPDAWGIEDYLPELYPGEFKIEVQKADGTWGFFDNGTNRMDAIRRVIEDAETTGRPLGSYRVSHRMFMDPDVLRVSNARHWKFVGDLADALAVTQDDILAASRGVISTKGRREKFWGSLKHRAGFEQYRKDMLFVLSLYHSGFARWHWLTDIRRAVAPGIEEIRRRGQPNLADEIEANLEILWGRRSGTSRHLDASIERIPILRDYHVAGTLERVTNRTKGLSAVLFLLTSPRFHLVNRLQTWQTLWPLVSNAEFFWGHALWGFGPWGGKLVLIGDEVYFPGRFDATHPIPADGVVLDGPEILRRHGIKHLASGKFYGEGEVSVLHRAKEAIRHRTPEALARRAPERYNQEVAFLTLYLKGRRAGMSDRAAADYAFLQGNLRSQFAGAKTDQPRLLGRTIPTGEAAPVKSVITQYKRFQVANLGLGFDLLKEAARKDPTGRRHPAGFLKWLGALVAIGGLKGLLNPFLGLLGLGTLGAGWLTMKSYDALKEEVGEWQADLVMYGLPSVLGIDLSYSMQLLDTPLSRNLPGSVFQMLLGPIGSLLAGGVGAAWEDKRHGYVVSPWERGWKAVAQRAPGLRAIGAAEQLARGETMIRDPAGRARFRANLTDMLRYAAGFRTMTQAEQDRIVSAFLDVAVQRDRVVEASTKELVGLGPNPTERDIEEAWKRVGRRLDRWNGLFPEGYFVITGKDVNQRIKDREKFRDLDVLERVVARAPKSLREYFRGRSEERVRGKAEAAP